MTNERSKNEQKQYLVSICIPTYNRFTYLKKSLESLIVQPEFLDGRVEIVVADNHSEDGTEAYCQNLSERFPNFNYYRHKENIGGNLNPMLATDLGTGNLLKLCNDDLIFTPYALNLLCYYEQKYEKDKPHLYFSLNGSKNVSFNREKEVDFEGFLYASSYRITWISTFAIWREDLDKFIEDKIGLDCLCWQVEESLDVLDLKNSGVIIDNKFAIRQPIKGKDVSYDIFQPFYVNLLAMLKPFCDKGDVSIECYEWVRKDILTDFMPRWMVMQELHVGSYKYSCKTNLKKDVLNECKNLPYYNEVLNKYRRLKLVMMVKQIVKTIIGSE